MLPTYWTLYLHLNHPTLLAQAAALVARLQASMEVTHGSLTIGPELPPLSDCMVTHGSPEPELPYTRLS